MFIVRGRRFLEAVAANELEARLLQVERGSPLIRLESISYLEDGRPLEYYHAVHRGDRSRFEVELVRSRNYEHALETEQPASEQYPDHLDLTGGVPRNVFLGRSRLRPTWATTVLNEREELAIVMPGPPRPRELCAAKLRRTVL